uniref:Thyroglobulin type-1 domain-containing protein n=1 Tax=Mola mola TaxID=94237 RepID=A0A3Q3WD25_MOLML
MLPPILDFISEGQAEQLFHTPSPFLITENMWPRGCVLDCQRGRHRAVCGSNGRLYKSLCAFQRAQCINTQLRPAPRAHCSGTQLYRYHHNLKIMFPKYTNTFKPTVPAAAVFVPECHPDGHYLPVQCHNQTGYCWCSTPDGQPVSRTSVFHLIPNCTEVSLNIDSKVLSVLTAPPILVTILMNSDPKGNRSVRRRPGKCRRACCLYGRYSPVQCHTATGYCWCVRVDNGRPLPGTSKCYGVVLHVELKSSLLCFSGCPGARKNNMTSTPPSSSSTSLAVASPAALGSSGPEAVLQWHFRQLDVDSSGVMSEHEARPLRHFLRQRLKPRRCAKKFAQYCDRDGDRGLTLNELRLTTCKSFSRQCSG